MSTEYIFSRTHINSIASDLIVIGPKKAKSAVKSIHIAKRGASKVIGAICSDNCDSASSVGISKVKASRAKRSFKSTI